jgi:hypothetical protein
MYHPPERLTDQPWRCATLRLTDVDIDELALSRTTGASIINVQCDDGSAAPDHCTNGRHDSDSERDC